MNLSIIKIGNSTVGQLDIQHRCQQSESLQNEILKKEFCYDIVQTFDLSFRERLSQLSLYVIYKLGNILSVYSRKSWKEAEKSAKALLTAGVRINSATINESFFNEKARVARGTLEKVEELRQFLVRNQEFAQEAVKRNGIYLKHFQKFFSANEEVVRLAVASNSNAFEFVDAEYAAKYAMEEFKKGHLPVRLLSALPEKLKSNRNFFLELIGFTECFSYFPMEWKNDKEIAQKAVARDPVQFYSASKELRGDSQFVLKLLRDNNAIHSQKLIILNIAEELALNEEFIKDVVKMNSALFNYLKEEKKQDKRLLIQLVQLNPLVRYELSKELRDDPEIVAADTSSKRVLEDAEFFAAQAGLL